MSGRRKRRIWSVLALAALGCMVSGESLSAQEPSPVDEIEDPGYVADVTAHARTPESANMNETIGGGPQLVGSYYYTSPLEQFGQDLLVGSYALNLVVSIGYLALVYPVRALSGHGKPDPVMLWLLLPIAGPWFAQYESSVKSKPFWRVVLIGDAALQATGLVLGLIGLALSGKRQRRPAAASGVELNLGVEGAGLAGITLSVHAL